MEQSLNLYHFYLTIGFEFSDYGLIPLKLSLSLLMNDSKYWVHVTNPSVHDVRGMIGTIDYCSV